jgi:hypothetical protein
MVSFTARLLYPQGKSSCYPLDRGGWLGPRASLDAVVKRKIPSPCRDSNPPIIQPVAQRYTTELSWLLIYTGNAYKILAGKPERKRPRGRPRRRWEDNIRMDLRETGL